MISLDYLRTMVAYGTWMNRTLADAAARLSEADRKRDMGAFFKSLHGTLDHLLWGDLIWMQRFDGKPAPTAAVGSVLYPDWEELVAQRHATDARMRDWAAGEVTADWLAAPYAYVSKLTRRRRTLPAWVMVTHMLNHGTHHRGQATTLLMQLGIDPGVTDLVAMPTLFDGSLGLEAKDEGAA